MVHIHTTEEILKHLNECIINKQPFSTIRFGDGCLGIVASLLSPDLINRGKWSGGRNNPIMRSVFNKLGIPAKLRIEIAKRLVEAANNADYIDSYDAFFTGIGRKKGLGLLSSSWLDIHKKVGIENESYCNPYLHYMSIVDGEYNLFTIMKNRSIFCVSNQVQISESLKEKSNAKIIDVFKIPRRGKKLHYRKFYKNVIDIINKNATKYDLFLIGAGVLGKIYCNEIKKLGGRAFDAGRLFDLWSGLRTDIDSVPKRFIKMNKNKMLCDRIYKPNTGVW